MINIVFLGAPGSGKGTQAAIIQKKINIPKLSTGDILRQMVSKESELSTKLKKLKKIKNITNFKIALAKLLAPWLKKWA